MCSILW